MQTYDLKRERKDLYAPKRRDFEIVEVPGMGFLMIDGHGDPNTSATYREAIEALYMASYAVRAMVKTRCARVHTVAPLEALRSARDWEAFRTREGATSRSTSLMLARPNPAS